MYLYLYDYSLSGKKYNNKLVRIETRLTDLGIGGKIFRLSPLRNATELIAEEIKNGANTIVVVGNDKTLSQVINLAAKYDIVLGLIPIGQPNAIAKMLGLPEGEAACDIIAARIVERIDLGKINNTYFLSGLDIKNGKITLECENQCKIMPTQESSQVTICNLKPLCYPETGMAPYFNPKDGFLEILIQPIARKFFKLFKKSVVESIIPTKKLLIKGDDDTTIITDGQKIIKTPATVDVAPRKLRVIVGKKRLF